MAICRVENRSLSEQLEKSRSAERRLQSDVNLRHRNTFRDEQLIASLNEVQVRMIANRSWLIRVLDENQSYGRGEGLASADEFGCGQS